MLLWREGDDPPSPRLKARRRSDYVVASELLFFKAEIVSIESHNGISFNLPELGFGAYLARQTP
jgi:hypothetical protein